MNESTPPAGTIVLVDAAGPAKPRIKLDIAYRFSNLHKLNKR